MTTNPDTWHDLCTYVEHVMQDKGVPGVAVGILHKGDMTTAGFGITNADHPLSVTDDTLFQIGSITKTYTGTAIMRLVEQGKIDLDAPVRTYVPDFKVRDESATAGATMRHLLTHTGGWEGDYFDDTGAGDDGLANYVANMTELEQLAPMGKVWSYNNAGFSLAGHIIEMVTGQTYKVALKELVLEPLGLENSYLDPGAVMTHRFAVGHHISGGQAVVARPWPLARSAWAAGGIACHINDLLCYARFHLGDGTTDDGTRLLTPESMAQMQATQVTVRDDEAWGLSWAIDAVDGARQVGHGGGTMGQVSWLGLIPEHHFAVAILTNADPGGHVTKKVRERAMELYLELDSVDPTPIEATEDELAQYVGVYSRPFMDFELGILGGRLIAQVTFKGSFPTKDTPPPPAPPPFTLAPYAQDRLLVLDGPMADTQIDMVRNDDGSIGWLRTYRIHQRQS